jgi:hypothetical protein
MGFEKGAELKLHALILQGTVRLIFQSGRPRRAPPRDNGPTNLLRPGPLTSRKETDQVLGPPGIYWPTSKDQG